MSILIRMATPADAALFAQAHDDVFDSPPRADLVARYLDAPHLHIALALEGALIIGMCSGVVYYHPDKPEDYWINELGVATPWRRRGIARGLISQTCSHARALGCSTAWVVADPTEEAMGFYRSLDAEQTGENLAMFSFDLCRL